MFQWYSQADVCLTYLDDVTASGPGVIPKRRADCGGDGSLESEWFERGWTLQELLSPRKMEFYDRQWNSMGTRDTLADGLARVTRIERNFLTSGPNRMATLLGASTATKLSWMAGRTTVLVEDIAYSMLGLLEVSLDPRHGEGYQAFMRLQQALIENSPDESIFAWIAPSNGLACYRDQSGASPQWSPDTWGLLAPSPDCFRGSSKVVILPDKIVSRPGASYQWTNQGVQFNVAFRDNKNFFGLSKSKLDFPLNCWIKNEKDKAETVVLKLSADRSGGWSRSLSGETVIGTKAGAKPGNNRSMGVDQVLTAPMTIVQPLLRI